MKKIILIFGIISLMASGCVKVELKKEIPSSPPASYQELPK